LGLGKYQIVQYLSVLSVAKLPLKTFCTLQNRKQVLKLAGLDLSADRSGKTSYSATPVISQKGKADLRYALYH
jgi:hypothetical protein